jgi:GntR family transcriptional regulator, transcriptional repressor for pyruvate dehydrogenase complex
MVSIIVMFDAMISPARNPAPQMRQRRLAEMVAGTLRERIVSGELGDGAVLPGLDRLVQEFGVSPPSLREALRILENEGLITVRRGNLGGAVVHRPHPEAAAYLFGLVLQAGAVPVSDLVTALGHLEPLCARLCATRPNRARTVVPLLRRLHRASEAVIEDAVAFEQACRAFHDGLVEGCGNASIAHLVSALEWLWHHQDEGWAHRVAVLHEYPDVALRREGLRAHARLLAAIVAGRADEAESLARAHHASPGIRSVAQSRATVNATSIER